MKIPQGRQLRQNGLDCKIFKSLYGLKQAKRLENKIVIKFFQKFNFNIKNGDLCILILVYKEDFIIIKVYIDNLLLRSKSYTVLK